MSKPDAYQIHQFLNALSASPWVRETERRDWPSFAYHYTDIRNAVEVLKNKMLLSRTQLDQRGILPVSSGSDQVLANTNSSIKDCVRLYFRPKTPTQYHAEGVKSKFALAQSNFPDAHCPVPIFFLFDLAEVLSLASSQFSDRGLAGQFYTLCSTAEELESLDWRKIYHLGPTQDREIIACRNAEIIIPQFLDLEYLRAIYCRSEAELETLKYLLPEEVSSEYAGRMFSSSRLALYERRHTYLESVRLASDKVSLHFSPETKSNGPFTLRVEFFSLSGTLLLSQIKEGFYVKSQNGLYRWHVNTPGYEYQIYVYLDDALVYANSYSDWDIPF